MHLITPDAQTALVENFHSSGQLGGDERVDVEIQAILDEGELAQRREAGAEGAEPVRRLFQRAAIEIILAKDQLLERFRFFKLPQLIDVPTVDREGVQRAPEQPHQ